MIVVVVTIIIPSGKDDNNLFGRIVGVGPTATTIP